MKIWTKALLLVSCPSLSLLAPLHFILLSFDWPFCFLLNFRVEDILSLPLLHQISLEEAKKGGILILLKIKIEMNLCKWREGKR